MNKLIFIVILTVLSHQTKAFNILDLFKIISDSPDVNFDGIIKQLEPANINITIVRSKVRSNEDLESTLDSITDIARQSGIVHVIDNFENSKSSEDQSDNIIDLNDGQDVSSVIEAEVR